MKFNVNEYVRVKLTPTGKDILCKKFDELHAKFPQAFKELSLPKEDAEGFSQWQMWSLFASFGEHIYLGCNPPFETEIEIVEKAFQHSVHPTLLTEPVNYCNPVNGVHAPFCTGHKSQSG